MASRFIAMAFRGVLVHLAVAVAGQHGGLFVGGRGSSMCATGFRVPFRRRLVCAASPLERLLGAEPRTLNAAHAGG
jgi:hypothetical protein